MSRRFDDLRSAFAILRLATAQAEIESATTARDRSMLSKVIIWVWVLSIITLFVVAMVAFWFSYDLPLPADLVPAAPTAGSRPNIAGFIRDVVATMVMPIVTLMIGFYFGSKSDRR
jgi:hypothetical protein